MNELEKEIPKALDDAYKKAGQNVYFGNGFELGCKFILEKNLIGQFGEWFMNNCYRFSDGLSDGYLYNYEGVNGNIKTTEQIQDYWLNNIYGKEK